MTPGLKIIKGPASTLVLTLVALALSPAKGYMPPIDPASVLEANGYPTDTTQQIIEAANSDSYFIRHTALELLTKRVAKEAVPTLKAALNDPKLLVRTRAAHFLGTLGDQSGLVRMRRDFKELATHDGILPPLDPDLTDPNKIRREEAKRNLRIYDALKVAKVLAELGDRRGYKLAARAALEGSLRWQRYEAILTLVEIAKTNPETLRAEGLDPVFVLRAMGESEADEHVFYLLTNMVAQNLSDDAAISILETARNSAVQPGKVRDVAQSHLDKVRARKKASENK